MELVGTIFDQEFEAFFGRPQTTIFNTYRVGDLMFDGHTFCHENANPTINTFCAALTETGSETITQNPDKSYDFAFFKHVS